MNVYSYNTNFLIDGNTSHKTGIGACLNLMILATYLAGVFYFSLDIFKSTNPRVIQSGAIDLYPALIQFMPQDFSFTFSLTDPETYQAYRNESIYFPEFYLITLDQGLLVERRRIRSEPCDRLNHFGDIDKSVFKDDFPFNNYYCIHKEDQIWMEGSLTSKRIRYFQIQVKMCNETINPKPDKKCAPQEVIDK